MARKDNLYEIHLVLEAAGIPINGVRYNDATDQVTVDFNNASAAQITQANNIISNQDHKKIDDRKEFRAKNPPGDIIDLILDWFDTGVISAPLAKAIADRKRLR
jgi:hypothetical protein